MILTLKLSRRALTTKIVLALLFVPAAATARQATSTPTLAPALTTAPTPARALALLFDAASLGRDNLVAPVQTAQMMALFGRSEQVGMLVAAGAAPILADANGLTAAPVAAEQGNATPTGKLAPVR